MDWLLEREDVQQVWKEFTEHEFVEKMGDGTLPVERFKFYMVQDYLYLVSHIMVCCWNVTDCTRRNLLERMRSPATRPRPWKVLPQYVILANILIVAQLTSSAVRRHRNPHPYRNQTPRLRMPRARCNNGRTPQLRRTPSMHSILPLHSRHRRLRRLARPADSNVPLPPWLPPHCQTTFCASRPCCSKDSKSLSPMD